MSEPFVRADVGAFIDLVAANPSPPLSSIPIAQSRAALRNQKALVEADPNPVAHVEDLQYQGPDGAMPMRYYDNRETRDDAPVIVYIHGGGFAIHDIDYYDSVAREFARQTDLPVISIGYRLAPEHPFPAAHDDCEAAVRHIASGELDLPFDIRGMALSGDSAGGNLAIATTLALNENPSSQPVIALGAIYPMVTDNSRYESMRRFATGYVLELPTMTYFAKSYAAPRGDPRIDVVSRDLSTLPPTAVMTATLDPLHDQGVEFVEKLKQAGVEVRHYEAEGNIHGLITCRKICPSSQEDLDAFLRLLTLIIEENIDERP